MRRIHLGGITHNASRSSDRAEEVAALRARLVVSTVLTGDGGFMFSGINARPYAALDRE